MVHLDRNTEIGMMIEVSDWLIILIILTFNKISKLTERGDFKNVQRFEAFPQRTPPPKATVLGS